MKNKSTFSAMLESDFYKLFRLKSVFICPIIMVLLIALNFGMFWWLNKVTASVPGGIQELTIKTMLFASSGNANIPLFIAIICSLFVGSEFAHGLIKNNVARGSNRLQIYFSKMIVLSVLVVIYTLGSYLVSGIFIGISKAIPSVASGFHIFDTTTVGQFARTVFLQIWTNISVTSIFMMLAFLLRTSGSAIGVNLAVYFLSGIILTIVGALSSQVAWLEKVLLYIPNMITLTIVSTPTFTTPIWLRVTFMPLAYLIVSSLIGISTFLKRDIK